jgi:hypothetical protein
VRRTERDVFGQRHRGILDDDRDNLNRTPWPGSLFFPRLAFDERCQVPPAVGAARRGNPGPHDRNALDDDPGLQQLAQTVRERDVVDADQRLAVLRQADVTELNPPEYRPAKRSDLESRRQELVRLTHDQLANLIFGPARLKRRERGTDQDQDQYDERHEGSRKKPKAPTESA